MNSAVVVGLLAALVACSSDRATPAAEKAASKQGLGGICLLINPEVCDDGNPCTLDRCELVLLTCSHTPILNCCTNAGQCDDGVACTSDSCNTVENECVFTPLPACCSTAGQCNDDDPCTTDTCSGGQCRNMRRPECCVLDSECDDGEACTTDSCKLASNTCDNEAIPNCCTQDADCPAPGECLLAHCNLLDARCEPEPDPACTPDAGVPDAGVPDAGTFDATPVDATGPPDAGRADAAPMIDAGEPFGYAGGACSVAVGQGGSRSGAGAVLVVLVGALAVVVRRRRRAPLVVTGVALAGASAASSAPAHAAESGARVERYTAPTGADDLLWLERGSVVGHLQPVLRVTLSFADDPLVTRANADDAQGSRVLDYQAGAFISAGVTLWNRGQLSIGVPVFLQDGTSVMLGGNETAPGSTAVGDPSVDARWALARRGAPLEAALAVTVRAPWGGEHDLVGGQGWQVAPRVALSFRLPRPNSYAGLVAGVDLHDEDHLGPMALGSGLVGSAGAVVGLTSWLGITGEIAASTPFDDAFTTRRTPVEGTMGARLSLGAGLVMSLGVGAGFTSGVGAPDVRGLLSLAAGAHPDLARGPVAPPPPVDADHDGVPDAQDRCPGEPEDHDGFQDDDGCPDPDNDGDGVADADDRCPQAAEDRDGFQDDDGCPDEDNDGDGLADARDKCPVDAEDKDGFQDDDGCPDADNDGDGLADADDKCPTEAETKNGTDDDDGCPDFIRVDRAEGRIQVLEAVYFVTGGHEIQKRSWPMLEELAKLLNEHPELGRVGIEGHTDDVGGARRNLALSSRRAKSVMAFLVARGVDPARLEATGFGMTRPIAGNDTREGKAKNRRVEFHLLDGETVDVTVSP